MYFKLDQNKSEDYISLSALPSGKNILIFSPHPDDAVIGMGALINQLVKNNNVKIFYFTSGYRGVSLSYIKNGEWSKKDTNFLIKNKSRIATEIRKVEAINALKKLGCCEQKIKFLDLPFYYKDNVGADDLKILSNNLKNVKIDLIYICGDFSDPHGTHYKSFRIFMEYLKNSKLSFDSILLYKDIWEKFSYNQIDYVFCFNDNIMNKKIASIKSHYSQLEPAYPDKKEVPFWKKAKIFNKRNAGFFKKINGYKYMEFFSKLYLKKRV